VFNANLSSISAIYRGVDIICIMFTYNVNVDSKLRLFSNPVIHIEAVVVVIVWPVPPLKLWVQIPLMMRCTWYNFMWSSLSASCDRLVVFSGYSGFLHQ